MNQETTDKHTGQGTSEISPVLVHLFKGVLYKERQPALWQDLLRFHARVKEYFGLVGLMVLIDEEEGYAFVKQIRNDDENASELPRLIQRRQLSYPLSLLCVLLRKKLVELDAVGGETRLILSRDQIVDMLRVFLRETSNEARMVEQIDRHISRLTDYGFLRPLKGDETRFEVHRIIKALVNGEWLSDFNKKLRTYHDYAEAS